ncbi:hypothetical protein B0H10DRAFT_2231069 [Mycena sp. CBHHK59/15]|nr:hypothetical protein B0H10DRAFT_2231069 [Mycena sp. CBHHK59/15]
MPPDAELRSKHTPADQQSLDSLSARQLMDFRNYLFSPAFIALNAAKFLDHEWDSTRLSTSSDPIRVKVEATPSVPPGSAVSVKAELHAIGVPQGSDIKMRTLNEDGREVFELLSDSESELDHPDSDMEVIEELRHTSRSSSTIPSSRGDSVHDSETEFGEPQMASPSDDEAENSSDSESELLESDTVWQDDGTSLVRIGKFKPTQKVTVERMEYREGPASIYPILRIPTGIVIDLSDEKYWLRDPVTNELTMTRGGGARAGAKVTFAPGEKAIDCQRIRATCKGVHACDQLDAALRDVVRFELDPASRDAISAAQQETRRRKGNTSEDRVALFVTVIRGAKCLAVDSNGNKCRGGPILKPKSYGATRGHQYFVGCSGWTPKFQKDHLTHSIPDHVDENLLARALAGQPLTEDPTKDTPPCSAIIHPHTGLKKKHCAHPHIQNGTQVTCARHTVGQRVNLGSGSKQCDTDVPGAELGTFDALFDPAFLGLPAEPLDSLIPFDPVVPAADPLEEFMNLYGFSGDLAGTGDFSTFVHADPLPLLPPPPPTDMKRDLGVDQLWDGSGENDERGIHPFHSGGNFDVVPNITRKKEG